MAGKLEVPAEDDADLKSGLQEESSIKLYNQYIWLRNKNRELKTLIDYERKKSEVPEASSESTIEKTQLLLSQSEEKMHENMISGEMIARAQLADVLYKATFSSMGILDGSDECLEGIISDEMQDHIHKLLKEEMRLSSLISKESKEVKALKREVLDMQQVLLKKASQRSYLMKKLQSMEQLRKAEEEKDKEKNERIIQKCASNEKVVCITNHILQLLVTNSGVKWGKDPHLLELVIECGKPIEEQLEAIGSQ